MDKKIKINRTIVVEGKSDASNISKVFEANFIITSGLHISQKTFEEIKFVAESSGIIIFTDPDSPGKTIRRKIVEYLEKFSNEPIDELVKHAYISAKEGRKDGDLGVENARAESIIAAFENLKSETNLQISSDSDSYIMQDLIDLGLSGSKNSKQNREYLCAKLHIEYSNSKSLLKKLNFYKIEKIRLESILKSLI